MKRISSISVKEMSKIKIPTTLAITRLLHLRVYVFIRALQTSYQMLQSVDARCRFTSSFVELVVLVVSGDEIIELMEDC